MQQGSLPPFSHSDKAIILTPPAPPASPEPVARKAARRWVDRKWRALFVT